MQYLVLANKTVKQNKYLRGIRKIIIFNSITDHLFDDESALLKLATLEARPEALMSLIE